jgi:hypothetical protein
MSLVKDVFRKAIRRGWDDFGKWVEERHLERELDLRLGFGAAEAAVAEVIADVFEVQLAAENWETRLSAGGASDQDYQSSVEAVCQESSSNRTDVRLKAFVSPMSEDDGEEDKDKVASVLGLQLLRDPPAVVFDPVIRWLDAMAGEVMAQIPGSTRGPLRKRFRTAEFDLHLPLPRLEAVDTLLPRLKNLPAHDGELLSLSSFLRLDDVLVGAATAAVHTWVVQDPDRSVVSVEIVCRLRSPSTRPAVERRLDRAVELLNAVG